MNGAPVAGPPPSGWPVALSIPVRRATVAALTAIASALGTG